MIAPARAIVMGASAGALDALMEILPRVPAAAKVPVIVCVHVPRHTPSLLVDIFARVCAVPVRAPWDKELASPGIWFAVPDYHLLVEPDGRFSFNSDAPVHFSRPSIDVLFESAANAFGDGVVAVLLTGANEDGALGARAVRDAGGLVVVQDPSTAEATAMPAAAVRLADPQVVAPLPEIATLLQRIAASVP